MPTESDDFFVGYLATSRPLSRWLLGATTGLAIVITSLAVSLARVQRDPGNGIWDLDNASTIEGVILLKACPLIRILTPEGSIVSILLVDQGKQGARNRLADCNEKHVRLHGHTLSRARLKMFELEEGQAAVEVLHSPPDPRLFAAQITSPPQEVTLTGEIVDPKCFSGAMKPGEGKTHKACAALCLRGGIPPVFVSSRGEVYLIIDDNNSSPTGENLTHLISLVGDWIEVIGKSEQSGDLPFLSITSAQRK